MQKRRLKKPIRIVLLTLSILIILSLLFISYYGYSLSKVNNNTKTKEFIINQGDSVTSIIDRLEKENLIRGKWAVKVYIRLHNINNIQAGSYEISSSYSTKKIINMISAGLVSTKNEINLTFKEGDNIREYAKVISTNTNNKEEDVFNLLKNEAYINELISTYWFITDDVKNKNLYYPLEGYLAPNTYRFKNKDVTVKEIFKKMLDQMNGILTKYKKSIQDKGFTVHKFLTMASIVESEGVDNEDRPSIASVFYNRLDIGMSFGSCATACYAAKFDGACAPKNVNTSINSPYNTYLTSMVGLPVGPISNPSEGSIKAAITPEDTNYLFFIADKYRKTYLFTDINKRDQKIQELIKADRWFE